MSQFMCQQQIHDDGGDFPCVDFKRKRTISLEINDGDRDNSSKDGGIKYSPFDKIGQIRDGDSS